MSEFPGLSARPAHGGYPIIGAMTTDRWQHFTEDELDALTDALDQYIANQDGMEDDLRVAGALFDEIAARAAEVDDDG